MIYFTVVDGRIGLFWFLTVCTKLLKFLPIAGRRLGEKERGMRSSRKLDRWLIVVSMVLFIMMVSTAYGETIHVSISTGKNKNAGTKEAPMKNLDKAIKKAKEGDTLLVAEGTYSGTFGIGYIVIDKAIKLYGGYSTDFSGRDIINHPTVFQPDNKSGAKSRKALITLGKAGKSLDGAVLDGLIIDMGMRNSYSPKDGKPKGVETGMLLLPPKKASGEKATVTKQCLFISNGTKGGNVTISNNVFLNSALYAIQGGLPSGTLTITNNVFVSNRMATIEVWGTSAKEIPNAEISYNTILFTWSRLKDFMDMGYGVRIMTKMKYNIHHNIIAAAILTGVDNTRFADDEMVQLDENLFFLNKQSDMEYSPESNTKLNLAADEFEDLELASVSGNINEVPKGLPIDKAYLEGFLSARYTEEEDYDSDSPANQMRAMLGLNKQGKLTTSVSMFGNRYSLKEALKLFGAVDGVGAKKPQ